MGGGSVGRREGGVKLGGQVEVRWRALHTWVMSLYLHQWAKGPTGLSRFSSKEMRFSICPSGRITWYP